MSVIRFEKDELEAWADYSGDYNPIHFDEQIADKAIGMGGVVIHGMLAMLHVKSSHSSMDWAEKDWIEWRAQLRSAMPLNTEYQLESRVVSPESEIRFKLKSVQAEQVKINGQCRITDFDTDPYLDRDRLSIPAQAAREALEKFRIQFPEMSAAWIAIDAMIFSHYINKHADEVFQGISARYRDTQNSPIPALENIVTMQTHHNDIFRSTLLHDGDFSNLESFEYSYYITDELFTKDSVFLIVELPVWINSSLSQVVQIGLMARHLPTATI